MDFNSKYKLVLQTSSNPQYHQNCKGFMLLFLFFGGIVEILAHIKSMARKKIAWIRVTLSRYEKARVWRTPKKRLKSKEDCSTSGHLKKNVS